MSDLPDEDPYAGIGQDTWERILGRRLDQIEAMKGATSSYIHQMSAWMIAQLFIANAGGLTLHVEASNRFAAIAFASGLVLSMFCALAAWGQAQLVFRYLAIQSDPAALLGVTHVPSQELTPWEGRLFRGTLAAGLCSLVAFVVGIALRI